MTRPTTDHIVASGLFRCLHCGSSYAGPDTATPIDALISVIRGFALMHRHCQPKAETSPQLALPHTEQNPNGFGRPGHATYHGPPKYSPLVNEVLAGIDGNSDAPDPETDPPGAHSTVHGNGLTISVGTIDEIDPLDETDADGNPLPPPAYPQFVIDQELERKFREHYPIARANWTLHADLGVVLQRIEGAKLPTPKALSVLDPQWRSFQKAAGWVRDELADMNRKEHPEFDCFLPLERQPMPEELAALVFPAKKPKRGARPLTSRKRKGATTEAP